MRTDCVWYLILLMILLNCSMSEGAILNERTDFLKISQTEAFVDKTELIKSILQPGRRFLITAPPKFGKSTNLQMIKLFLSTNSLEMKTIRDTFSSLRIHKEDNTFFESNFGTWPVLYVDFSTKTIILCIKDVVKQLKRSIHYSYIEHNYLLKSPRLDDYEKYLCSKWMSDYKEMQEYDTSVGLRNLAKYLNKHYKKPVIVLVDGYDHMIDDAMIHIADDLLFKRVVQLISSVLENLVNSKSVMVETMVIMGVSYLSTCGIVGVKHLEKFEFLEDHQFSKYFGFSLHETNNILKKSSTNINYLGKIKAIEVCGGYKSKGNLSLLNPYCVVQLVNTGTHIGYVFPPVLSKQLLYLLKFSNIENCIDILLSGKSFKTTIYRRISKEKVIELKDIYQKMVEDVPDVNLFLSHLMELGYLSYVVSEGDVENVNEVKLPNQKIKKSLLTVYKRYYIKSYNLNVTDVQDIGYDEFKLALNSCKEFNNNMTTEKSANIWTKLKESIKSLFSKR